MKPVVKAIIAMSEQRVIGIKNTLPWHLPEDLKRFSQLTTGHSVLMGRKTYQSLPDKFRPLPNRQNIVVSRSENLELPADVLTTADPRQFIKDFKSGKKELSSNELWVIGGAGIFKETIDLLDGVELTLVKGEYEGDVFLPEFEADFNLQDQQEIDSCLFLSYQKN